MWFSHSILNTWVMRVRSGALCRMPWNGSNSLAIKETDLTEVKTNSQHFQKTQSDSKEDWMDSFPIFQKRKVGNEININRETGNKLLDFLVCSFTNLNTAGNLLLIISANRNNNLLIMLIISITAIKNKT